MCLDLRRRMPRQTWSAHTRSGWTPQRDTAASTCEYRRAAVTPPLLPETCPMSRFLYACFLYGRSVLRMLFVWEKCPPHAFCMGEVSSAMLFVWGKCPPPCFVYGRSVLRHALCMGEVSSAMLFVWEKCPPPCFLYGRSVLPRLFVWEMGEVS